MQREVAVNPSFSTNPLRIFASLYRKPLQCSAVAENNSWNGKNANTKGGNTYGLHETRECPVRVF